VSLFDRIRAAAARVAARARSVRIDDAHMAPLAEILEPALAAPASLDPAHHHRGDDASTLAYVIVLDAVNFGSGWFPQLRKRPGCSGYFTVASALAERFDRDGAPSAAELRAATAGDCAALFGQDLAVPDVAELMGLFARAWSDLGALLEARFDGRFERLIGTAGASAERLVGILTEMPFYRDVSLYDGFEVPLYKRAQLTAADLALAFEGRGPGRFDDLDELTIFADNLVPHVLRREGVLVYDPDLAARIDAGHLIEAGSPEEVEIRAVALHAVERLAVHFAGRGRPVTARRLDYALWNRGQLPEIKAHPRHRSRTVYY